ncbi:hypothetical protein Rai3103_15400 [Raineyella fluvialis]|uniref:Uncharacterized protein n=1 Tax=Raineyella fluvialis TaxID=2662261 RepID=A0A5Q2FFU2_9ACTN|nr:hypothetical protein Rai3103_15400 [Raineyella fluvialis]
MTGYSYWDNSPAGSAAVSNSVLHAKAGGTGTYADPITVAVGFTGSGGRTSSMDWQPGTRFYVPKLQRYLIVEDICGACHLGAKSGASTRLDVWIDGAAAGRAASATCMDRITGPGQVIVDPDSSHPVTAGPISNGTCATQGSAS